MIRSVRRRLQRRIRRVTGWDGFWWIAGVAFILAIGIILSCRFWEELRGDGESLSTTVRNLGFVIGGVIAIVLAVWRSVVAERQADTARRQSETAERGLLNERYQKGAEMLGNDVLSVRLGGIYALRRLAEEHPEEYHVQIMRLFCAFARHPTREKTEEIVENEKDEDSLDFRLDIDAVMEAVGLRSERSIELEKNAEFHIDLRGAKLHNLFWSNLENVNLYRANLSFADLSGGSFRAHTNLSWIHGVRVNLSNACLANMNLSGADLWGANLSDTLLFNTDLSRANLQEANLSRADLRGTDLSGSHFTDANLSGTIFSLEDGGSSVRGLTQVQLNAAKADPDNPPKIDCGTVDIETGKPLIWRERPPGRR